MDWVVKATPRSLYRRERPGTHWLCPRAGTDGCRKSRLPPGFDPRPVQPVASRYTDCTIQAHDVRGLSGKYSAILTILRTGRVALM
jgi:hypothetical protein